VKTEEVQKQENNNDAEDTPEDNSAKVQEALKEAASN
jgi:hypothetical protein